jgi:hypothetical protein
LNDVLETPGSSIKQASGSKTKRIQRKHKQRPASQQGNNGFLRGQDQPNQGRDDDEGYVPSKGHITAMIQPVPKSNKEEKSITRQVNLAVTSHPATTKYLHWSEQPIEFSRDDRPIIVPRPGNAPLVLKAQIGTYNIEKYSWMQEVE